MSQPHDDSLVGVEAQTASTQPFRDIDNTLTKSLMARRRLEHLGTPGSRQRIGGY